MISASMQATVLKQPHFILWAEAKQKNGKTPKHGGKTTETQTTEKPPKHNMGSEPQDGLQTGLMNGYREPATAPGCAQLK